MQTYPGGFRGSRGYKTEFALGLELGGRVMENLFWQNPYLPKDRQQRISNLAAISVRQWSPTHEDDAA